MPLDDLEDAQNTEIARKLTPLSHSPAGLRSWLNHMTKALEVTPTELARKAEVAPSTLNRFIQGDDGSKNLGARTIAKLVAALIPLYREKQNLAHNFSDEPLGYAAVSVRVAASVRCGIFRTSHVWPAEEQFYVQVPLPSSRTTRLVGLVVADDEAATAYPYGTIVIAKAVDEATSLTTGQRLVVTIANELGETEIALRALVISPNQDAWLTSLSGRSGTPDVYLGKTSELAPTQRVGTHKIDFVIISSIQPEANVFGDVVFV